MRIVFCGTPEFAVPSLRRLLSDPQITVEAVVTQPDRPRGRRQEVLPSPVKVVAVEAGLPVYQPETIRSESSFDFFQRLQPDAVVIIAYGQIVPRRLIEMPRLGWINLHGSLLPKYRGAAPIAWAICNGERVTGLTTMQIDAGMDTGPIVLQHAVEIGPDETEPELRARLAEAGPGLVVESLVKLDRREISAAPQDSANATYAPMLKKEHGRIDWSSSAEAIYNRIRGLAPWPGAYTAFRGRLCHVWGRPAATGATAAVMIAGAMPGAMIPASGGISVLCGGGTVLDVQALQLEARKRVNVSEFLNGARWRDGERFGD